MLAESVSSRSELGLVLGSVPAGTPLFTVLLTCDIDTALSRALADPSRGISRQEDFLRRVHAEWARQQPQLPADLALDTGTVPLAESVHRIRAAITARYQRAVRPGPADELIAAARRPWTAEIWNG